MRTACAHCSAERARAGWTSSWTLAPTPAFWTLSHRAPCCAREHFFSFSLRAAHRTFTAWTPRTHHPWTLPAVLVFAPPSSHGRSLVPRNRTTGLSDSLSRIAAHRLSTQFFRVLGLNYLSPPTAAPTRTHTPGSNKCWDTHFVLPEHLFLYGHRVWIFLSCMRSSSVSFAALLYGTHCWTVLGFYWTATLAALELSRLLRTYYHHSPGPLLTPPHAPPRASLLGIRLSHWISHLTARCTVSRLRVYAPTFLFTTYGSRLLSSLPFHTVFASWDMSRITPHSAAHLTAPDLYRCLAPVASAWTASPPRLFDRAIKQDRA